MGHLLAWYPPSILYGPALPGPYVIAVGAINRRYKLSKSFLKRLNLVQKTENCFFEEEDFLRN